MDNDPDLIENTGDPIKWERPTTIHMLLFLMRQRMANANEINIKLYPKIDLDTLRLISFN
jgi:hypothetical protein